MGPTGRNPGSTTSDHRVMSGSFATDVPTGNWILNERDMTKLTPPNFLERDFGSRRRFPAHRGGGKCFVPHFLL